MMHRGGMSASHADIGRILFDGYPPTVVRSSSVAISRLSIVISGHPTLRNASAFPSGCRGAPQPFSS